MDVINCISTNEPNQTSNSCNNRVFLCSHSHQKQKKTRSKPSIEPDSRTAGQCTASVCVGLSNICYLGVLKEQIT